MEPWFWLTCRGVSSWASHLLILSLSFLPSQMGYSWHCPSFQGPWEKDTERRAEEILWEMVAPAQPLVGRGGPGWGCHKLTGDPRGL